MTDTEPAHTIEHVGTYPRPAAVAFVTTENSTPRGARSSTISEATGRATVFLGAVSGGLLTLGLVASATDVGAVFYAFGLILLPTLALVGLVTVDRVLQSGIEDHGYARGVAKLRGFQHAPELTHHLLSVPAARRLGIQGLRVGRWQNFVTVAGTVSVVTAVLAGSAAGLLAAVVNDNDPLAALVAGPLAAFAALAALLRFQAAAWNRARVAQLFIDD